MVNTLKLPVGIDSFEKIRRNGFYYIDKTNLIEQILMNWGEVTLQRIKNYAMRTWESIR